VKAAEDIEPSTDPNLLFWREARSVFAERGNFGEFRERHRTEIRSRWTENSLYFLFICPYENLHLNPDPQTVTETFGLWNRDVAEVFIGSDFENIRRYKEFEISPQGEWVDLDIDLANPRHEDGWVWKSDLAAAACIDSVAKIWYGAMRIPFPALQGRPAEAGQIFRVNLFRTEGAEADRVAVQWQPTGARTFHVPEQFGQLRLTDLSK
jgi:hypothetical protein